MRQAFRSCWLCELCEAGYWVAAGVSGEDVAELLDSPEVAALIDALAPQGRGRKGFGPRTLVGACLVKALFALPTWTRVAALIAEHPGLQAALGGSPSVWACYRFTVKLRENQPVLADCLDRVSATLQEALPQYGRTSSLTRATARVRERERYVYQGGPERGYYSYDLGAWHVAVLNPECGDLVQTCDKSLQEQWLRNDLQSHPSTCSMVLMNERRYSSGSVHGNHNEFANYSQVMYDNGVDVALAGDDHDYERFAPQDTSAVYDPQHGIRQFVAGTGGRLHYLFSDGGVVKANSEARDHTAFGILKLTLHPTGYDWQFIPQASKTFTDSGTTGCH
jgi:hypothetical protein